MFEIERNDFLIIKKRKAKKSSRGIYLQDLQLKETVFKTGTRYKYTIDNNNRQIIITSSESTEGGNLVSKRSIKNGTKPVIDIRSKNAINAFEGSDFLNVEIYQDRVIVTGFSESKEDSYPKKDFELEINKEQLEGNTTIGEKASAIPVQKLKLLSPALRDIEIPLKVASLFSGAGMFDQGFVEEGYEVVFAIEKNPDATETYKANVGDHIYNEDITTFDFGKIEDTKAPIMIGGSPCQGFSNSNRYTNFLSNPNNLLVNYFIEAVKQNSHCRVFVLENVPQILSAGGGKFKEEICDKLSDFEISTGILNSTNMGGAQSRDRAFFIGSKIGKIDLPKETHNKGSFKTVRDAFKMLNDSTPNQKDYSKPKKATVDRMSHIPQGGNWQDIPTHLKTKGMLGKGTHSSVYKRLDLDKPSITITNPRKSIITHPTENRILSIRECARLFGLSDNFIFKGPISAMQQQVANGVPAELSKSIAKAIKKVVDTFNSKLSFV